MTRDELLEALNAPGRFVAEQNRVIDLAIYGGWNLMLVSNFRLSSGDVDAVAQTDQAYVDAAARRVATALQLPDDWPNDGVRTYLSPCGGQSEHHVFFRSFPDEKQPGIRIYVPTGEYMLAMKLMSLRIGRDDSKDLDNIVNLCHVTRVYTEAAMIELSAMFFPEARVSGKLRLSVGHIARLVAQHAYDTTPHYLGRGRKPSE